MSSHGNDYDGAHYPDDEESHRSDDDSDNDNNYEPEMINDQQNPKMERINTIVHLVFPRLPARTLLCFKSVSPNFKELISSPFMVRSHAMQPKALSGVFYQQPDQSAQGIPGQICYLSFDAPSTNLPNPSLSYLPEPVTIMASTHGLLCVRGLHTLTFYITNPTTMEWVDLPVQPTLDNIDTDKVAVVIVFDEPSVYNFNSDYQVVCAYPITENVYSFITFASLNWAWTESGEKHVDYVKNIVAASGIAVGAVAYWRTGFDFILSYDPVKDKANTMQRPHWELGKIRWELGEMNGQLSVTSRSYFGQVLVSMTAANNGENPSWKEMANFWLSGADALPIRSQGLPNLVFWEVNGNARGLVLRDMEGHQVRNFEELTDNYGFVPYISTLVPVNR